MSDGFCEKAVTSTTLDVADAFLQVPRACRERPCVVKLQSKCAMLLHVDILFLEEQQWLSEVFLSPWTERRFQAELNDGSTGIQVEALNF